jgi:large subunit ribosomal protein L31e
MPVERVYVIPLSRAKRAPRYKRTNRAVKLVREFLSRHMKSDQIKIDRALNQKLWARGARKPPSRVRVRAVKQDDGTVQASLAE